MAGLVMMGLGVGRTEAQPAAPAYHLVQTTPLGAPDRWDYVVFDRPSHRVYVAHGDTLSVVDGPSGRLVGKVEGIAGGTHGTAVSVAAGQGFTDDGKAGVVVAFDLATLKILTRIPAADDADGIVADPVTGHIFVVDGDPGKVSVIDPRTDAGIATLDGGGKLEAAVADGRGRLFVNGEAKRDVVVIDTRTDRVLAHWPIPDCESPHGIAVDPVGGRLFTSCENSLMEVLDTSTGKVVAAVPIGLGSDSAAWDPKRKRAFSSNGADGTISVIQQKTADSYEALAPIVTVRSGRTMDLDPETGRLFVAAADLDPNVAPGARRRALPGSLRLLSYDPR